MLAQIYGVYNDFSDTKVVKLCRQTDGVTGDCCIYGMPLPENVYVHLWRVESNSVLVLYLELK